MTQNSRRKVLLTTGIITVGAVAVLLGRNVLARNSTVLPSSSPEAGTVENTQTGTVHKDIGESFTLAVTGGRNLDKLTYAIESADITEEVIVNGQRIRGVPGKTFLVLNIKVTNPNNQAIKINSRDYVRMAAPGTNDEWWAPEIFNDPLEIQAISTKSGRVGFSIPNDLDEYVFRVGEINGNKKEIIVTP